eukprot:CAMPEP_0204829700 /NCGR_PEP_ID=MMETSP1346-20131115/8001_1 /ASSEMBLY_ACC=CAM_ASM_000771 /TAXON_ID=215587 /ORGANISM="Aplanochytrium stocchinoi, Strain GSBS06" /LENGTH=444 /DNA_ID=CAMNT_0051959707 /DNA_START=63 /DNA_END=1397 /DNA_ORIENTATION=+
MTETHKLDQILPKSEDGNKAVPDPYGLVGPKKKFALLFGYNGIGYKGLQINPGAKTIESELENAICKTGVILGSNQHDLQKISWSRAARTDKGVHALGQCVALKLCLKLGREEAFIQELNKVLPDSIKAFDCIRVANKFNAKFQCFGRIYEYWIPAYLLSSNETVCMYEPINANEENQKAENIIKLQALQKRLSDLKVEEAKLKLLETCLKKYEGTKDFHNFTVKVAPNDPARKRFILSFKVDKSIVVDGMEMIKVAVEGQSFMLHQIRNMVGLAVEVTRNNLDPAIIDEAINAEYFPTPMAPGEGLALRACQYGAYNKKYCVPIQESKKYIGFEPKSEKENLIRRPIQFLEGHIADRIEKFGLNMILPAVVHNEKENCVFTKWLWDRAHETFPKNISRKRLGAHSNYEKYKDEKATAKRLHKEAKITNRNVEINEKPEKEKSN